MVTLRGSRLVIAGTGSGVGKTSIALGLVRELTRRGLRVQTFKVGPDFLDPTWLAMASGRTCYNLDGWMTSREYVQRLFARATADADFALIEGVMGMFDGASPSTIEGSTAEIASWLDAPVLLVVPAHGAARSLAATVKGFAEFEPAAGVSGVIANQSGSGRHREWLAESLCAAGLPPLVGAVPRGALPELSNRHLGLVSADGENLAPAILEQLADACREHVDVARVVEMAGKNCLPLPPRATTGVVPGGEGLGGRGDGCREGRRDAKPQFPGAQNPHQPALTLGHHVSGRSQGESGPEERVSQNSASRLRLGIARDEAFHFYYPDNLESFDHGGVQWQPFSPLADAALPDDLDGLYFGGGYPELHAARLAENRGMLTAIRDFAASGRAIYAECGGLMYLGRSLTGLDGRRHALAGVLPLDTAMLPRLRTLGYAEVSLTADCLWGPAGQTCRGHEFHYSKITAGDGAAEGWRPAYTVRRRRDADAPEGFARGNILASYIHLHWASRPDAIQNFLSRCEAYA